MAEKTLNTRVLLKHDTLANWNSASSITLKKGEVAITTVETKQTNANGAIVTVPVTLMKVGDGEKKFSALPWTSALAADVYAWAKENALFVHKDGTGNVVSGIEWDATLNEGKGGVKYTTAAVATAEGLEDLQEAVAAIEKDITDNRNAWVLDTDTRYSFSTDGDKLVVKKTLYTNGVAGAEEAVGTYEFLTADEVAETLKGYYTKSEVDGLIQGVKDIVNGLDESITTVTEGTGISVSDAGTGNDHAYTVALNVDGAKAALGLQDAAYTTVESLNATAKGYADAVEAKLPTSADYGVLEVTKGDDTITIGGTAQNPTIAVAANKFDAYGAAAAAEGRINTKLEGYYTKTEADAAFTTPAEVISEVNKALSEVSGTDAITNITTLVEYVNEHGGDLTDLITEVYGAAEMTGNSRIDELNTKADAKLDHIKVELTNGDDYIKFSSTNAAGEVDSFKITGEDIISFGKDANGDIVLGLGETVEERFRALEENDADYATETYVDDAIKGLDVSDITGFGAGKTLATLTETDGKIAATFQNIAITKDQVSGFGTMADESADDYYTKEDLKQVPTALNLSQAEYYNNEVVLEWRELGQATESIIVFKGTNGIEISATSGDMTIDASALSNRILVLEENEAGYATTGEVETAKQEAITEAANQGAVVLAEAQKYADDLAENYATSEQGAKADSAVQSVTAPAKADGTPSGIVASRTGNDVTLAIDESITWIFDCGGAGV